ncbi:MAG TPA: hypothetical protein VFT57_08045 [Gemmatimonadaceae bacterium]|jgi:hypothetical protein|nr:hypothetical protein [Gemmatimonadaceae bacterium]
MTSHSTRRASSARSVGRLVLFCAVVAAIAACGSDGKAPTAPPDDPADSATPPEPPKPAPNFIQLASDAGDYIGGGRTYDYNQANAIITVSAAPGHLSLRVRGDEWWEADIVTPEGVPLQAGTYTNVTRYPFNESTTGGLSWFGEGRGCNTLTGSFTIDTVAYRDSALAAIDLDFDQHCEGADAALRGTIHWSVDDTTAPPGPVNPIPTDLWKPYSGAVAIPGNYVYLASDAGDWIGQGVTRAYTPPEFPIVVSSNYGHISVSVAGWNGDFVPMDGRFAMEVGYYGGLQRYPFHNPAKGGLDWSGNGRGCNTLTGWFVIDRVVYVGTTVKELDMRFEQHCEGGEAALHGAIHWTA